MEEIKSSVRPFKNKEQSHKSLRGDTTYYRIHLNSGHREAHTTVSDASFDVSGVFPVTGRQDLLDGHWEVFVEEWVAYFASSVSTNSGVYGTFPRWSMKLCLPDLMLSPQDYTTSAIGKAIRDDSVCHVPLDYKFRGASYSVPSAYHNCVVTRGVHIFDGIHANANQIQVQSTANMIPQSPIHFQGNGLGPGALTFGVQYYIKQVVDATHITISQTRRGAVMVQQTATADFSVIAGGGFEVNEIQSPYTVPADTLNHVETRWNNVIAHDSIGRKIDPHQLLNGSLRVLLRDRDHKTIFTVAGGVGVQEGSLFAGDRWQATLLFVHKK